ncbi:unnamed protein product [Ilex paraguariensis]|uniref:Uncharacterized protein n=1 Tax=Ilex paraguariensis TaxID=185542 RepID=A0ABC8SAM5_9AQUA
MSGCCLRCFLECLVYGSQYSFFATPVAMSIEHVQWLRPPWEEVTTRRALLPFCLGMLHWIVISGNNVLFFVNVNKNCSNVALYCIMALGFGRSKGIILSFNCGS